MNNQHPAALQAQHPIEIALAIALVAIESVLWLINELMGFHKHKDSVPTPHQIKSTRQQQYAELVETYTVKQLRALTGITTRRVLKDELKLKALCLMV